MCNQPILIMSDHPRARSDQTDATIARLASQLDETRSCKFHDQIMDASRARDPLLRGGPRDGLKRRPGVAIVFVEARIEAHDDDEQSVASRLLQFPAQPGFIVVKR